MMRVHPLLSATKRYAVDRSGLAAFEVVIWLGVLFPALLSIVDLGTFAFVRMQVENAAQVGAQAAWSNCDSPPLSNCPTITAAVDAAVGDTSLGGSVARLGEVAGGYYCTDIDTQELVANGTASTCDDGRRAGYYAQVTATYAFNPLFPGVSVGELLPDAISQTAWTRLK
jgi:Flp pilus assembly protein TadG